MARISCFMQARTPSRLAANTVAKSALSLSAMATGTSVPKTVDEAAWTGSSIARGDLADEIAALRHQHGGEIVAWGGANFAQSLSRAGLVDEYVLVIQPVAFGSGLPLFADLPDALRLELIEAKTFGSTVLHIYEPSDRATRPRA